MGELVLGIDPGLNTTGYGLVEITAKGPQLREAGLVRGAAAARWSGDSGRSTKGLWKSWRVFGRP